MTTVQTILDKKGTFVATIGPDDTVLTAARRMNDRRIGALMVMDGDKVKGIFTERDILTRVVAEQRDPAATRVGDVMTTEMAVCPAETPLADCRAQMTSRRIRHLPIVEGDRLLGIITSGDIMAHESAEQQETIEHLNQYVYNYR